MIDPETRTYLNKMSAEHQITLGEAVRALIDMGRDVRDTAGGEISLTPARWIAAGAK